MILPHSPSGRLPTAAELPCSDDTPVDNELQNLAPNLLEEILCRIWAERANWFCGVDMGIYYDPQKPPFVPDGFLSLGVPRLKGDDLRLSYVLWEENYVIPTLFLELVSQTYGGEYDHKLRDYEAFGVLYYVIFNPFCLSKYGRIRRRYRQHQVLEVYQLTSTGYQLLTGNPIWLPELGLGLGWEVGTYRGRTLEWLYWYNQNGQRYLSTEEVAEQAQQRAEKLEAYLRSQGIDPESLL
uniref:Putative restriction endonuclease domain-containing protein n=1 Tax=Cyanothece sp. (strain PCC 7425 / ATCC 29141) TaxID=395961 RepID=B8HW08_CYAP4